MWETTKTASAFYSSQKAKKHFFYRFDQLFTKMCYIQGTIKGNFCDYGHIPKNQSCLFFFLKYHGRKTNESH